MTTNIIPTRQYIDFSFTFSKHPVTKDLLKVKEENAVKNSIKNIVLTSRKERPFVPNFGCGVRELLFKNITTDTAISIKAEIERSIKNYEPRANVEQVTVIPDPNNFRFDVSIVFTLNNSIEPITVDFFLERLR